jgi:hypothetical protein
MSWPWASPEATRRGLADRVKRRHPGPEVQRRLYEVAFRRVLDLGDHFSFVVLRAGPEQRYAGLDETTPLRVEARIGGRRWVEFGIDLGYTEDSTPTEPCCRARI